MQTFLPYESFSKSAYALDDKRLGKQRVETLQILNALRQPNYGWQHHPAVRMWVGHEYLLTIYGKMMCQEWVRRGFKDTCWGKFDVIQRELLDTPPLNGGVRGKNPWWMGEPLLHRSHQSNLIRKDPDHYRPQFPNVPDDLPYFWPSKHQPGEMNEYGSTTRTTWQDARPVLGSCVDHSAHERALGEHA